MESQVTLLSPYDPTTALCSILSGVIMKAAQISIHYRIRVTRVSRSHFWNGLQHSQHSLNWYCTCYYDITHSTHWNCVACSSSSFSSNKTRNFIETYKFNSNCHFLLPSFLPRYSTLYKIRTIHMPLLVSSEKQKPTCSVVSGHILTCAAIVNPSCCNVHTASNDTF